MTRKLWFLLFILSASISIVSAQNTCPALVQTALETAAVICEGTGRNQICYGNDSIEVAPLDEAIDFNFSEVGDIEDVLDISQMSLSPLDEDSDDWGIAIMRLQTNLLESLPGQSVLFVLFGDVTMDVATSVEIEVMVNANGSVNIRGGASTRNAIVGYAASGDTLLAVGRNEAGDWIQIRHGEDEEIGWIADFLIDTDSDLSQLSVVSNEETAPSAQSFYFNTGIGDSRCTESPESGILVQTPQDVGEIQLTLNGVDISLGSTAYIQINEENGFATYLLEGQAKLETHELTQTLPEGYVFTIALDENLRPNEQVWSLEGYNSDQLRSLPVPLLDRQIEIAEPSNPSFYDFWGCEVILSFGPPIEAGRLVYVGGGVGGYSTAEALENDISERAGIVLIDGVSLPIIRSDPPQINSDDGLYAKTEFVAWIPTSGTHTFVLDYSHATESPYTTVFVCTVTVP